MNDAPSQDAPNRFLLLLRAALIAGASLYVAVYLVIAPIRMMYPFELEWIEGLSTETAVRMAQGEPMYEAPSMRYSPTGYLPLYYYISSWTIALLGEGFHSLRFISILSSVGVFAMIFWMVRLKTGGWLAPWLAVCTFAATYELSGGYVDTARCDTMALLWLLASGLAVWLYQDKWPAAIPAGILLGFAVLTRQSTWPVVFSMGVYLLAMRRWKFCVIATATAMVTAFAPTLYLNWKTEGWLWQCVFIWPMREIHHRLSPIPVIAWGWLIPLALINVTAFWAFVREVRERNFRDFLFFLLWGGSIGAFAVYSRTVDGADDNHWIAWFGALAVAFGLGFDAIEKFLSNTPKPAVFRGFYYVLLTLQFAALVFHPLNYLPTREDRQAGEKLLALMRNYPGEVWLAFHSYIPRMAGKNSYASIHVAKYRSIGVETGQRLQKEFDQAIHGHFFDAIILDGYDLPDDWEQYYKRIGPVFEDPEAFLQVCGYQTRPRSIFEPRQPGEVGDAPTPHEQGGK